MTTTPWTEPAATGYGRLIHLNTYAEHVRSTLGNFRAHPVSVMGEGAPHVIAILDFASAQREITRVRERSGLTLEHDRMDRVLAIVVKPAVWFAGCEIFVRTCAWWIVNGDENTFSTWIERRWFGLTTLSAIAVFRDVLELALRDAKSYTTDELVPLSEAARRAKPWD